VNADAAPSPHLTARELLGAVALAVVLALVMHWPLPLHLGEVIAQDLGDPLVQAWQIAWDGHALKTQPLSLFQANTFWPMRDSLAVSDALVGYAPAGLVGEGVHAAVARYDLLFLVAYALCFAGAYLLARELGAGRAGAFVAGAAFAYAPWRLEQEGHLHIVSLRRDRAGRLPAALRLPACVARDDPRGLARRDLAVLARVLARAAAHLPARRGRARGRYRLVAARAPAPGAPGRDRDRRGDAVLRGRGGPAGAALRARPGRPSGGGADDRQRRLVLGPAV